MRHECQTCCGRGWINGRKSMRTCPECDGMAYTINHTADIIRDDIGSILDRIEE